MPAPRALLLSGLVIAGGAQAAGSDDLLAGLRAESAQPQAQCEWVARRFARADRTLSLYREELQNLVLSVDGKPLADTARGGVQRVVLETRLFGPASAAITLGPTIAAPARGNHVLELAFTSASAAPQPLFCGVLAFQQPDPATRRTELVALMPRTGSEGRGSAQYQDQTEVDVIKSVARAANLVLEVRDQSPRQRPPVIVRDSVATWPFLRDLSDRLRMNLVLGSDGVLWLTEGAFVPPAPPPVQSWNNEDWVHIAARLASDAGRTGDAQFLRLFAHLSIQQRSSDDDFIADLAVMHEASAYWSPGKLMMRDDGVWKANAAVQTSPAVSLTPWQLADQFAKRYGLTLRTPTFYTAPVTVLRQQETDVELLFRMLGASGLRIVTSGTDLYLVTARSSGDVADLLLRRVTIAGSPNRGRRFVRKHADLRSQVLKPDGVASTDALLDLGAALPALPAVSPPLADTTATAAAIEAALARLGAHATTPMDRFLQDIARAYRPTLIHLYRLRPDGVQQLDAITGDGP